ARPGVAASGHASHLPGCGARTSTRRGAHAASFRARSVTRRKLQETFERGLERRRRWNGVCFAAAQREGRGRKRRMLARPWQVLLLVLGAAWVAPAAGQNSDNPECLGSQCGTPQEEGGGCGCGCGCGCSVWVSYTDDGKTLAYTDDADGYGKSDGFDN